MFRVGPFILSDRQMPGANPSESTGPSDGASSRGGDTRVSRTRPCMPCVEPLSNRTVGKSCADQVNRANHQLFSVVGVWAPMGTVRESDERMRAREALEVLGSAAAPGSGGASGSAHGH